MALIDNTPPTGSQLPGAIPPVAEMSERERALRDLFVMHYLMDYDQVKAAQRCGFTYQFAVEYAKKFMEEPYVQQKLNEVTFSKMDQRALEEYDKTRIRAALMAEAHYRGPGSSHAGRVAALGKLAALYGMEAPKKSTMDVTHKGGVMAVPGIATLDDWESQASDSQDKLVENARNG
jgi:cytochrome c5